jgi:hypothetical protein
VADERSRAQRTPVCRNSGSRPHWPDAASKPATARRPTMVPVRQDVLTEFGRAQCEGQGRGRGRRSSSGTAGSYCLSWRHGQWFPAGDSPAHRVQRAAILASPLHELTGLLPRSGLPQPRMPSRWMFAVTIKSQSDRCERRPEGPHLDQDRLPVREAARHKQLWPIVPDTV